MGMWKPDTEIYYAVLDSINLQPNEVIFFDDNQLNIESAKSIGMQTVLVEPSTSIVEYGK
jgi:putative hydrolase of the HAD superfamily